MHIPVSLRFMYDTAEPSDFLVHINAPLMAFDRGPVAPMINTLLVVYEGSTAEISTIGSTFIGAA